MKRFLLGLGLMIAGWQGNALAYDMEERCREFKQVISVGDDSERTYGTVCQRRDGNWEVVSASDDPFAHRKYMRQMRKQNNYGPRSGTIKPPSFQIVYPSSWWPHRGGGDDRWEGYGNRDSRDTHKSVAKPGRYGHSW